MTYRMVVTFLLGAVHFITIANLPCHLTKIAGLVRRTRAAEVEASGLNIPKIEGFRTRKDKR